MKKILSIVSLITIGLISLVIISNNKESGKVVIENNYKVVARDTYSFEVPKEWTEATPQDVNGCRWDGVVNAGADGHRQNGEIGIYKKSCFDLSKSLGKKEIAEKDGYYIIAYYDKESGTTDEEITQTKAVHQKIVSTFSVK